MAEEDIYIEYKHLTSENYKTVKRRITESVNQYENSNTPKDKPFYVGIMAEQFTFRQMFEILGHARNKAQITDMIFVKNGKAIYGNNL